MTETPVLFGPGRTLVGVLTQPENPARSEVAFLMLNAGLISRIGPHRFNVKLARALAGAGQTGMRFDLSGLGDSRGVSSSVDFLVQAVRDIRSAMDHLEQACGLRRFALVGICSGAVNALAAAVADPRVIGVLMIDGYTYRTPWTMPVRRWKRFRAASWREVGANLARRLSGKRKPPADAVQAGDQLGLAPANPPRAEFARQLQILADRRVAVFLMYSGSFIESYSYSSQFRHAFRGEKFVDAVRCDYRPDIDHTMLSLASQRKMIDVVLGWVPAVQQAAATT